MSKYTHHIIVPFSSSICVAVYTDEEIRDDEHAYDLAMGAIEKEGTRFIANNEDDGPSDFELGEELAFHKHMNRGNVCVAACSEISWETEEDEG